MILSRFQCQVIIQAYAAVLIYGLLFRLLRLIR